MRSADTAGPESGTAAHIGRIGRWPLRWHHALLSAWTACWFSVAERNGGVSWHYLRTGEQLLVGQVPGGGLALYANHPELQIGPVSFLGAAAFSPFPPGLQELLAEATMSGLGLYMLVLVGRAAADYYLGTGLNHKRLQQRVLTAGLALIPMWVEVSVRFAHLDDVLALFFTTLAVRALVNGRHITVGVFLALAVDSKPWAVAFLPLLLALPKHTRWRSAAWTVGLVAVAWLPFCIAHANTINAAHFTIPNHPASSLRWFGANNPVTPWWDRPAQMALGLGLGALAVLRGRWPAIVLLAADARIVLDPSVYTYYNASILLGTVIWDAIGRQRRVPLWSWIALISLYGSALIVPSDSTRGLIRLAFAVGSAAYVLLCPMREPHSGCPRPRAKPRSLRKHQRVPAGVVTETRRSRRPCGSAGCPACVRDGAFDAGGPCPARRARSGPSPGGRCGSRCTCGGPRQQVVCRHCGTDGARVCPHNGVLGRL
ncbi:hypothetical protein [Streptomyces sp. NPDC002619]|uniref:hypothetical protein n=1 Tax=Streptomyces sp. NPDC002619 TaxID=3364655 RepID=UPI0036A50D8C